MGLPMPTAGYPFWLMARNNTCLIGIDKND